VWIFAIDALGLTSLGDLLMLLAVFGVVVLAGGTRDAKHGVVTAAISCGIRISPGAAAKYGGIRRAVVWGIGILP